MIVKWRQTKLFIQGEYEIKQIDTYGFILVSRGATPKFIVKRYLEIT